ncbi:hypothetical protein PCC7424_2597 [Gloeothece citriformis PCC 7424]|uniref:Uncharacterized protein n=1 Tax=Gloeothece citriformis (strain PCC 7424) TaxID=65393 RepID=B7KKP2_GLOC7|nr:hypothetical protein [Gloeothece citriformis]ACK71011.1 hypothetical protein PCC7424_2597 [Gloeothece citriformis PCC 7424]
MDNTWKGFVRVGAIFWSFVLILFMFIGVGGSMTSGGKLPCKMPDECQELYLAAVADTMTFEEDEATLLPSLPLGKDVTVVTWAGVSYSNLMQKLTRAPIWVTLVPALKEKCQQYRYKDPELLDLRLKQLLGLPPSSTKSHFIEIKVNSRDLWRSCLNPDPRVSPCTDKLTQAERSRIAQLHPQFIKWFERVVEESYQAPGYPLTRMGYTYDWNPKASEFGLPEYLIRIGAKSTRFVRQIPTQDYCQVKSLNSRLIRVKD